MGVIFARSSSSPGVPMDPPSPGLVMLALATLEQDGEETVETEMKYSDRNQNLYSVQSLSVYLSVCLSGLSICLSGLFVCLSCLSIRRVCLSVCLSGLSVCLSGLFVCLSCLSIYLSICLSVCLSICLVESIYSVS